ncbi:MAG: hypothetical protein WDN24_12055 [Sphingomonas sp.]
MHAPIPVRTAALPEHLVAGAARCWHDASDAGRSTQQALHALLQPAGYGMLAPVLDSVMALGRCRFGRGFCAEPPRAASGDMPLLCRLLADPAELGDMAGGGGAGIDCAFRCALASVRIMVALDGPVPSGAGSR